MINKCKIKKVIFIILIIITSIIISNINIYDIFFNISLRAYKYISYDKNIMLHKNFYKIFKNIENINSKNFNKYDKVNVAKNSINQYKIIDIRNKHFFMENIMENIDINESLYQFLQICLKNIILDGQNVNIDDCVIVDLLKTNIQPFPSIHTDIEWGIFDKSNGFQVWYLYENDEDIGNMFLFETNNVMSSTHLLYDKKGISVRDQCDNKILKKYKNYDDINISVKYLNMHKGECLIFGKNLYHMSDFRKSLNRKCINFRVIIKDKDGGIPINFKKKCGYNKLFKLRLNKNSIKIFNNKIYPDMFELINLI